MNLKRSPFSILNKESREIDYIKGVYKRKIQAEIESYLDPEDLDDMKKEPVKKGVPFNWNFLDKIFPRFYPFLNSIVDPLSVCGSS